MSWGIHTLYKQEKESEIWLMFYGTLGFCLIFFGGQFVSGSVTDIPILLICYKYRQDRLKRRCYAAGCGLTICGS